MVEELHNEFLSYIGKNSVAEIYSFLRRNKLTNILCTLKTLFIISNYAGISSRKIIFLVLSMIISPNCLFKADKYCFSGVLLNILRFSFPVVSTAQSKTFFIGVDFSNS